MPDLPSSRRIWISVAGVLTLALGVRLLYLALFSRLPDWDLLTIDNWYHHNWALSITRGNLIGDTTYFRAPFYVWCLAAVYTVFDSSLWTARLFGIAVGIGSVAMTYLITRRLFSHRTGLIAAVIQGLCPIMFSFEAELLLDPLFALLVQICFYQLLIWNESNATRSCFLASLFCGLAAITRPTILGLVPFVGIWMLWRVRHSSSALVRHSIAGVLGLTLTVGVIFARNLIVAGDPVLVASQGGINAFISNNPSADGLSAAMPEPLGYNWRIQDITYLAEQETGWALKPGELSSYWSGKALGWIRSHPVQFLGLTVKRLWFSVANIEISNNRFIPALFARVWLLRYNPIRFGLVFALAVIGTAVSWQLRPGIRPVIWFIIGFTVLNAVFFYNSRFRLPLIPLYISLGAIAVELMLTNIRLLMKPAVLTLGALAAALSFAPVYMLPAGASTQDLSSRGLSRFNRGDYAGALTYYRQAAGYDSTAPETNLNIGATFLKLGNPDSASRYFLREISLYPDRPHAYTNLASLALLERHSTLAQQYARRCLSIRPYDATANTILIRAVLQDSGSTINQLWTLARTTAVMTKNDPWVCTEAGAALEERGDPAHAEQMYHLAAQSEDPPVEMDDQLFESTYDRTIARRRQERARANYALGSLAGRHGEYAQAVLFSRRSIYLDSTLPPPYINLTTAYLSLGERRAADSVLDLALRLFPGNQLVRQLTRQVRP